ncbi:hypothetical protein BDV36DRAFT_278515 [Aspergillus pseudocaelatus]|uniref:Uncharacterized protein n=1 Tax=Aspergillus pseudocaelatus TaxID=1825620 RepID=A0ABQ6VZ99_9EURO|nr:hypothetical protein BDV36DRAFT_278515 [Aspergillus pseudocaelatus]
MGRESYETTIQEAGRKETTRLLKSLNLYALLSRTSYLRNGITCTSPQPLLYERSARSFVMGDIYNELESLPFDNMGSRDLPRTDHIGPFA